MKFYKLFINNKLELYKQFITDFIKELKTFEIYYKRKETLRRLLYREDKFNFGIYALSYGTLSDELFKVHLENIKQTKLNTMRSIYHKNKVRYNTYHANYVKNNDLNIKIYQRLNYLKSKGKLQPDIKIKDLTKKILDNPNEKIYDDRRINFLMNHTE